MNYGDEFFLKAENYGDPDAPPLYVRYTPEGAPSPANRMPIRLSSTKDTNCRWSTIPLLPRDRLEGQGSAVKTGAKLIIKNCVADKNLCVMNQQWMQTFFGAECGVTVRNVIDIHKRFTAENIFTLVLYKVLRYKMSKPSKLDEDKGIVYCNRVLVGNWYEASKLEEYKLNQFLEQMKRGDLMLARYRKMTENLNTPTVLTQSTGSIEFGAKISLLAAHVPSSDPPKEGQNGLLLGARISSNEINYSQDLVDGCSVVAFPDLEPTEKNTFVITSADYCNRDGETLKYNQEFLLTLSKSVNKKPLYVRYDPNPIPGLCGMFPLYLSEHAVSNTRWRVLPAQSPNITRFEQEGKPVGVNTDVIINHCATNVNLGVNIGTWAMGFYGKLCAPLMKTCLDVYGRELPNNVWQIYIPIAS
ncbi:hypothetical protein MSG28_011009 [Choristoneura fumiferana]|uniref:Uncharacterized protein n=1 Tax=Choristoneura fumiferana TaxID=7141 RepID=A0ACC0KPM3_CHOFU|nr:hypothetical protein MSG28_011009 [Choristoneura fumiferana]